MTGNVATIEPMAPSNAPTNRWGLLLSALSHFTIELCHNFLPVVYPLLILSMDLSYQQIGYIALIIGLTTSLPQPFLGFLADRFGAYRVSGLSILWLGALMSLVGLAPNYLVFALLVGVASIGSSAYHPAGAVLASANSKARRGTGMSIFSVGGNLGSALSPLLIAALLPWLGLWAALVLLPIALVVGGLLYRQKEAAPVEQQEEAPTQSVTVHPPVDFDRLSPRGDERLPQSRQGSLLLIALILLTIASMTRSWFQVSLMTYLPVWVESEGGSLTLASQLLSVLAFAIGAGSMFGGTMSDRVGPWRIIIASLIIMAPAYWLFLNSSGTLQFLALALIGFSIGNTYPTFVIMAQDCWPQQAAVASGMIMGIGWAPGGLGAWFTGYLADAANLSYSLQFLLAPPVIGLFCMILWRIFARRN